MSLVAESEPGPRSKRAAILREAVEAFGEVGYEHTKWSTVADRVGIGQTALYHYFESKAHCLLTIMHLELQSSWDTFKQATEGLPPAQALPAAVASAYRVTEHEGLQRRILHNHIDLLATPRASAREEQERLASRALVQQIERDWAALLERGMRAGAFPRRDSQTMGRAVLGLVVSVWDWYRPGGPITLDQVSEFLQGCVARLVGPDPAPAVDPDREPAGPAAKVHAKATRKAGATGKAGKADKARERRA
jgi:AcrR family transcriptional regulator